MVLEDLAPLRGHALGQLGRFKHGGTAVGFPGHPADQQGGADGGDQQVQSRRRPPQANGQAATVTTAARASSCTARITNCRESSMWTAPSPLWSMLTPAGLMWHGQFGLAGRLSGPDRADRTGRVVGAGVAGWACRAGDEGLLGCGRGEWGGCSVGALVAVSNRQTRDFVRGSREGEHHMRETTQTIASPGA
ncbi:MAG: hypothetical protein Ct9H300mP1_16000 [Planctomycetaceae bacterium]|nr:MAG: hypothetical protein Ct9H300mP1_16000 [Planctomycetaceae bacterium]